MTNRSRHWTPFLSILIGLASVAAARQDVPPPRPADLQRADPDRRPSEPRADLAGRVTTVSPDGRTVTVSMQPRRPEGPRAAAPPDARGEQATFVINDRTQIAFFGVGEGEARPVPGLMAMVWLEDNSKDQAARVRFMKREGEERPDVQGRVTAISPDGRTVTVETRDNNDRPAGTIDLRLAPYTQSLFYGVDQGGARPTVNYAVVAWLERGSKDTPLRIRFMKNDPRDTSPPNAPPARRD